MLELSKTELYTTMKPEFRSSLEKPLSKSFGRE
jgi:hypothetical protein